MRLSAGLVLILTLFAQGLLAQRVQYARVKGTVIDSLERRPLEAATVSVFLSSDSSLVSYALTGKKGEFTINDIPREAPCWLMVSFNGYSPVIRQFTIASDKQDLDIKAILVSKSYDELGEVTVVAQKPPVVVRNDTLEFNVASFTTRPNSMIGEVLKQMPGAETDAEGNILINGKRVTKVTLDGKEFFGGDPKIALSNLPKEIIDKIQVTDNKTREARFNRTTDGNEDLAINLTIRKDRNKGWFGMAGGGYGTTDRYEGFANVNYFKGSRQVNVIANMNNTNRSVYSASDFNISSGRSTLGGGGNGITTTRAAGLNFSDNPGRAWKLNGSYFYNSTDQQYITRLQRQNILPDTTFFYNAATTSTNDMGNHRVSLNANFTPDTLMEVHLNTGFDASRNRSVAVNEAFSTGEAGKLINNSRNTLSGDARVHRLSTELFLGKRFRKSRRGISLSMNYHYNDQPAEDANSGENLFYKDDTLDNRDTLDQRSRSSNLGQAFSVAASWSEPLWESMTLYFRHHYTINRNETDKLTNRFNPLTGLYDIEDTVFTNAFSNMQETHSPGLSIHYQKSGWRGTVGTALQFLTQENYSVTDDSMFRQQFVNFTPSASIGYNFSRTFNLNLFYNGRSQQPSIHQLQPVPDNSNPLYIRQGNPDLQPAFYHNLHLSVRQTNGASFWNAGININTTMRQIIYETFFDEYGRQVSRPVNVNGNYNFSWNLQFSKSWKRRNWSLRMNLGSRGGYNRSLSFTNKIANRADAYNISPTLSLSFTYKEMLFLQPVLNIRYNVTKYSVSTIQDASYNTSRLGLNMFWNYPKRLIIENNVQYNYNSRTAPGFRKGVTLWSAAVNYQLFKQQQGTIRLAVYDILKQNLGIRRSITETYIEDHQSQVLQQYFLLSFIYNLRKFGG